MIHKDFLRYLTFTFLVGSLQGGLHVFCGTWRLALHLKNRTLHPVQLLDLGKADFRPWTDRITRNGKRGLCCSMNMTRCIIKEY